MRLRWLLALFLAPALVFGAMPVNAATPGIRTTKEYQALKSYVQELQAKRSQPQTAAEIAKYRSELSKRDTKAKAKVRQLYQERLSQAKQTKAKRQAKVKVLKQRKKTTIANLKKAEQGRLNAIAANRRAEVARITTKYNTQLNQLEKQRAKLRTKIAKAKNPVRKQNLQEELQAVQDQINTVSQEKADDIRIANNKYDDQVQTTKDNYDQRIEQAEMQADTNIQNLQQRLRELYQQAKQNAQTRRASEFADVKALYTRGVGYINEMQPTGEDAQ